MTLVQLRRLRWAARAVLTLGIAASITGNILHARPNPISQAISAWPPLAFLLTVELISRVPMHRRILAASRLGATAGIAAIAAWVSYWHMAGVAGRYGETFDAAHLLPLSVDGLIVVGSMSLVELAGRIRAANAPAEGAEHAVEQASDSGSSGSARTIPIPDKRIRAFLIDNHAARSVPAIREQFGVGEAQATRVLQGLDEPVPVNGFEGATA